MERRRCRLQAARTPRASCSSPMYLTRHLKTESAITCTDLYAVLGLLCDNQSAEYTRQSAEGIVLHNMTDHPN